MILLDVNVLVYAARREFDQHEVAREWLRGALAGDEAVAVSDEVLAGTIRLLTHHRVLRSPLTADAALDYCRAVRSGPAVLVPVPTSRRWSLFERLVAGLGLRAKDIPDALLAATALDLGAAVVTFDRAFRRFPDLSVVVPGSGG